MDFSIHNFEAITRRFPEQTDENQAKTQHIQRSKFEPGTSNTKKVYIKYIQGP
jgi:hypothetical protein